MKNLVILLLSIVLLGCTPSTNQSYGFVLPDDLKDCKVYEMYDGYKNVVVVRCPRSDVSTSHAEGKTRRYTSYTEQ